MANKNNDFLESLKVANQNQLNATKEIPYSDRDVYTCLKLMGDTAKVQNFLLSAREQEVDDKKVSTDMSINYFYNVCAKLGYAEFDFREGRIDGNEFNRKINEVCKSHNLDFDYLIKIVNQISLLEREPNREESIKLAQDIETRAIEEHKKRMNEEKDI